MKTICDTHVLLFDALTPQRLSAAARNALDTGEKSDELACADITLWEIGMLIARRRIRIAAPGERFINALLCARSIEVLPITAPISMLAQSERFQHGDPADRLIGATALHHRSALITRDEKLRAVEGLETVW